MNSYGDGYDVKVPYNCSSKVDETLKLNARNVNQKADKSEESQVYNFLSTDVPVNVNFANLEKPESK